MFIRNLAVPVIFGLGCLFFSCNSSTKSSDQTNNSGVVQAEKPSDYKEFASKFKAHSLPIALPGDVQNAAELDKKFVKGILSGEYTPAFGTEDVLPRLADNIDASKYFAGSSLKIDSFDAYIIHKQGDDDYYFLCLFDKNGKLTDGTWIAFTEGSNDDGTIREASINKDGSIEISQYNVYKGHPDRASSERHFYEITSAGKIRDLKENSNPARS